MSACEECWGLAYLRARTLGGNQADHYRQLLARERVGHYGTHMDTNETTGQKIAAEKEA